MGVTADHVALPAVPTAGHEPSRTGVPPGRGGRRAWSGSVTALVVPLAAGGLAEAATKRLGGGPSAAEAALYVTVAVACLLLARGRGAGRTLGLVSTPRSLVLAGAAAGVLRLVPWLIVVPTHAVRAAPLAILGAAVLTVGVATTSEELQFRGLLLTRLLVTVSLPVAVALSALAFAALHVLGSPWLLPAVAADGVLFAVCRTRSASVVPAWIAHATLNLGTLLRPADSSVSMLVVAAYVGCVLLTDAVLVAAVLSTATGRMREQRS
jgi:membrane protease YdiL (CAAX protease family)